MPPAFTTISTTSAADLREEWANVLSHGLGFLAAAAALPVAWQAGWLTHQPVSVLGGGIFALTMALVFGVSAVYHALPDRNRAKAWLQRADHAVIFLFIAGSYTPFALHELGSPSGRAAFAAVWTLALVGTVAKAAGRLRDMLRSTLLYVLMGWLAAAAALPVMERLSAIELLLVFAGGGAYMLGAVFFLIDRRLRYSHFVWHLFVLAGSGCHFAAAVQHLA